MACLELYFRKIFGGWLVEEGRLEPEAIVHVYLGRTSRSRLLRGLARILSWGFQARYFVEVN